LRLTRQNVRFRGLARTKDPETGSQANATGHPKVPCEIAMVGLSGRVCDRCRSLTPPLLQSTSLPGEPCRRPPPPRPLQRPRLPVRHPTRSHRASHPGTATRLSRGSADQGPVSRSERPTPPATSRPGVRGYGRAAVSGSERGVGRRPLRCGQILPREAHPPRGLNATILSCGAHTRPSPRGEPRGAHPRASAHAEQSRPGRSESLRWRPVSLAAT